MLQQPQMLVLTTDFFKGTAGGNLLPLRMAMLVIVWMQDLRFQKCWVFSLNFHSFLAHFVVFPSPFLFLY